MEKDTIQIGQIRLGLDEVAETLSAIRAGRIDAVVVESAAGNEVYTFRDPSHPFRMLVEAMNEGALLTTFDGIICYQNPRFSELVGVEPSEMKHRTLGDLVRLEQRLGYVHKGIERLMVGKPPAEGAQIAARISGLLCSAA